jgi:hypothetical protein
MTAIVGSDWLFYYYYTQTENNQSFWAACSDLVHCVNAFLMGSSNLSFATRYVHAHLSCAQRWWSCQWTIDLAWDTLNPNKDPLHLGTLCAVETWTNTIMNNIAAALVWYWQWIILSSVATGGYFVSNCHIRIVPRVFTCNNVKDLPEI